MNLFGMLEMSGSALTAERWRAEVVTSNMANAETTRTDRGGAYRRQLVVFREHPLRQFALQLADSRGTGWDVIGGTRNEGGVRIDQVVADPSALPGRYEPGHPDADAQGYVTYPNVNPALEMADLLSAVRGYQLNATALEATKGMIQQSLQILS